MHRADRIAFVAPRFSERGTVGGAETLLRNLAMRAAQQGRRVELLTTCAFDHRTWQNARAQGVEQVGPLRVHFFPVDPRDAQAAARLEVAMNRGSLLTDAEEQEWLRHSVNSRALCEHLQHHAADFDAVVAGPYLFGVSYRAALVCPRKTWLVPCLHDEPFARLGLMRKLFESVGGVLFNSEPEMELARSLFAIPASKCRIVGMGLDPFEADPRAFADRRGLSQPYVIYSGRREDGKGTPLLCDYVATFRSRTRRDIKLVLTGSGDIPAPPELQPHVVDLGFVSDREKWEAMAGAVAFVHPSIMESFGVVLLESWMARTPALVRADSRVLQWQCERSQGGLWFRNYVEFEIELLALLDRCGLRAALGNAGRRYVQEKYAWPVIEQLFFDAIDSTPA
jgi:glycosyltransferase involved in cell wall biosynthesis